jgi:hypothetical protein
VKPPEQAARFVSHGKELGAASGEAESLPEHDLSFHLLE